MRAFPVENFIYLFTLFKVSKEDSGMVNVTFAVPEELHKKMKRFSDIKWTEVARKAIEHRVQDLETLEKITAKSKLTQQDIEEFGKKIKRSAMQRFMHADRR